MRARGLAAAAVAALVVAVTSIIVGFTSLILEPLAGGGWLEASSTAARLPGGLVTLEAYWRPTTGGAVEVMIVVKNSGSEPLYYQASPYCIVDYGGGPFSVARPPAILVPMEAVGFKVTCPQPAREWRIDPGGQASAVFQVPRGLEGTAFKATVSLCQAGGSCTTLSVTVNPGTR